MKKMKIALASMLVAAGITATAGAANYTGCADRLKEVGLFQGTTQGYQLDKAPTRAEASAMLVRLLGKEAEAQKLTYTAPFTDLVGWEKPYVQYLYDNGLANGTSATTYNPTGTCSAQMYTTFLLRALGYSDSKGDFTYNGALDFGKKVDLVNDFNCNTKNFLRDDVVAMSLTALDTEVNDGTYRLLLEKLMDDGAVDEKKADSLYTFFMQEAAFDTAAAATAADTKTETAVNMDMDLASAGKTMYKVSMPMTVKTDMNLDNLDKSKMEMTGKMTMTMDPSVAEDGQTKIEQDIKYYYTDGVYYMDMGEAGKLKMDMSFEDIGNSMDVSSLNSNVPVCLIDSITEGNGGLTVTYNLQGMFGSDLFKEMTSGIGDSVSIDVSGLKVSATTKNGKITDSKISGKMDIKVMGETMTATINASSTVKATGNSVKVNLPSDLSSYEDIGTLVGSAE